MARSRPRIITEEKPCKRCGTMIIVITNSSVTHPPWHGACSDCYTDEERKQIDGVFERSINRQ